MSDEKPAESGGFGGGAPKGSLSATESGGFGGGAPKGWELVVGLEVHCELATKTKMFCGCANSFDTEPNTNICPVCLGLPGSLPVINQTAVEYAIRIGSALNCTVVPSTFHRKNYFYPDMTKDYQVSQYDQPINVDGYLDLPNGTRIGIERAHMEEDAGKSSHKGGSGRIAGADYSLVDYNRAGVPLVEIVSRPDIRSSEDARIYASELRAILIATGASDGKMEEGSMRVDANVSVRRYGDELGTRAEVKNVNSLRSLQRAIDYEAARQIDLLEAGGKIVQETRHWSEADGRTSSMRSKEEANDYRYFTEPDLVPMSPSPEWVASIAAALVPMPAARRGSLSEATGGELSPSSDPVVTVVDQGLDGLVLAAIAKGAPARSAINRAANELGAADALVISALNVDSFAAVLVMEADGKLTATQAKQVLAEVLASGGDPVAIAKARGFEAMDSGAAEGLVDQLIAAHPAEFQRLKDGDPKITGFFVGAAMKLSGGKADGKAITALLRTAAGL
jgi:aspartyl-tRNA(Asn)/glutamyl-tRNA(Gln) amidotransferase subunit B